jgi:predicted house-cleaning noncanonical NTP pyrophosphatase (MazG superfamily)
MTEEVTKSPIFKTEEQWQKEFKKQRASRLQDSVDEYMQDGEVSAFFEDLRAAIQDLIDYHGKQKENAQTLMKVVSGHRPFPMQLQQDFETQTSLLQKKIP